MSVEQAARQLVRALRGSRSQLAFSRRLGYRGNPVANWETGRRFPTARQLLVACRTAGVDVQAAFVRFLPAATTPERSVVDDLPRWMRELRGGAPLSVIAERAGCSRFAVSRFLSGKAEPRIPVFLRLVEALTGRASDLCAELVPIEQVPALEPSFRRRQAARLLAFHEPWTEAVLRVLETPAYAASEADSTAFIARTLELPEATIERCLEQLIGAGLVELDGARHRGIGNLTVDTQASAELVRRLRAHWAQVALARIEAPRAGDRFGYNVFSVAEADLTRIRGVLRAAFREIRGIVAESEGSQHVVLVNLQLMHLTPTTESGERS